MRISDWSSDVCSSDLSSQRQKDVYAIPREFGIRCGERGFRAGKRALDIQHFQARYHAAPGKPRLQPRRLAASISRSAQPRILVAVMGIFREDRKSVWEGKSVSVRVNLGGLRINQKKKKKET